MTIGELSVMSRQVFTSLKDAIFSSSHTASVNRYWGKRRTIDKYSDLRFLEKDICRSLTKNGWTLESGYGICQEESFVAYRGGATLKVSFERTIARR